MSEVHILITSSQWVDKYEKNFIHIDYSWVHTYYVDERGNEGSPSILYPNRYNTYICMVGLHMNSINIFYISSPTTHKHNSECSSDDTILHPAFTLLPFAPPPPLRPLMTFALNACGMNASNMLLQVPS